MDNFDLKKFTEQDVENFKKFANIIAEAFSGLKLMFTDFTKKVAEINAEEVIKKQKRRNRYIRKMNRFRANKKLKKLI